MSEPHTGGCRCGSVRFEAVADPVHVSFCHCADCRRASGAPVSAFVGFDNSAVTLTGGALKAFENGPVTRRFCGTCGSPISYEDSRVEGVVYFTLGSMDAPGHYKPTVHAYVREQLPFVHMPDGLPRELRTSVPRPDTEPRQ